MTSRGPELNEYLGSKRSVLGLTLFAVGAFTLIAVAVVASAALYKPADDGIVMPWVIGFTIWAVLSIGIGLRLRRGRGGPLSLLVAVILAVPLTIAFIWTRLS